MASQTAITAGAVSSLAKSADPYSSDHRAFLQTILSDIVALRNTVDAMVILFNAHTHKTPTSNPGATSSPTSDTGGSGSTGGTASAQTGPATIASGL